ncbi:hypothetical protein [Enterobacter hormaechei]|uniref:hypothetical protein n=1 Tax=Enterobacter hormaechei TaxID=158836 RepID=UPI0018C3283F|nr:hypothetical protein [Enterobacter hormaechei]
MFVKRQLSASVARSHAVLALARGYSLTDRIAPGDTARLRVGVLTWTGTVIANHLYNADDEFDDVIIELPPPWPSVLDIVVTGYPDGRDPESLPRVP